MPGSDTPSAAPDDTRPSAASGTGAGAEAERAGDPTQAPPPHIEADVEAQRILDQQHTGNHGKPAAERGASDRRGGAREGAATVEPETPAVSPEGRTGT